MIETPVVLKPMLRGQFHQAMFFVALGAGIPLISRSHGAREFFALAVYVGCSLAMFGISAIYHRVNWTPGRRLFWKKLDHAGIFLMIAGSFTPFCVLVLNEESGRTLLLTIWSVALLGILQSFFFIGVPKILSALIYLTAGYLVLPYISELKEKIGEGQVLFIFLGGVFYSIGAICYGLKWPVLWPRVFGYHEVFHLLVNLGAVFHFVVISSLID